MRKTTYLYQLFIVLCLLGFHNTIAQKNGSINDEFERLSLAAEFDKTEYQPLEPLVLKIVVSNKTNSILNLSSLPSATNIRLNIQHNGEIRKSGTLFSITRHDGGGCNKILDPFTATPQSLQEFIDMPDSLKNHCQIEPGKLLDEDVVLKQNLEEVFPLLGYYQVQVLLNGGGGKEIESNLIQIQIKKLMWSNKTGHKTHCKMKE